jgi:hypothetical protein
LKFKRDTLKEPSRRGKFELAVAALGVWFVTALKLAVCLPGALRQSSFTA